jgi:hypothetical protein
MKVVKDLNNFSLAKSTLHFFNLKRGLTTICSRQKKRQQVELAAALG